MGCTLHHPGQGSLPFSSRDGLFLAPVPTVGMPVEAEMTEIESTIEETLDTARKREERKRKKSRMEVYRKALKEVQRIAGNDPMRGLAGWIRERIRTEGRLPSGRDVRKKGAEICRDNGKEVSTGSWLGA